MALLATYDSVYRSKKGTPVCRYIVTGTAAEMNECVSNRDNLVKATQSEGLESAIRSRCFLARMDLWEPIDGLYDSDDLDRSTQDNGQSAGRSDPHTELRQLLVKG